MEIPKLNPSTRIREYRKQPEQIRDRIVYEYLFNGKSHRAIDDEIIGESSDYSRGWQSMGILHYLGIRDDFKGIFKDISIRDAMNRLSDKDKEHYWPIITSLMRLTLNQYSETDLGLYNHPMNAMKLFKIVGSSQHTDGVRIEKEFHGIFNPPGSSSYSARGSARSIHVLFNNKVFLAEYRYEDQSDKSIDLQSIRFRKDLKDEFKIVFPDAMGEFSIQLGADLSHFVFSYDQVVISSADDDDEAESESYPEGKSAYRMHKQRERNHKVIKKAKERFKKAHEGWLYCEMCGFDFFKVYGEVGRDFIEGHHKKPVSKMKEEDATMVEDIAMLCSNCHRMLHRGLTFGNIYR